MLTSLKNTSAQVKFFLFLCACFVLISCDSSDAVVKQVDADDRLSETELLQQHKHDESHLLQEHVARNVFYFGFDLRNSPQEDVAQYLPFLKYLESATGYQFKLSFTRKDSSIVEELGTNKVQFAAMGAVSFLKARSRYGAISIVQGLNNELNPQYRSFFVVRPDSRIRNINNFPGRTLAFGNRNSTQGHLIPRIILSKNQISLNDFSSHTYTGSHQACAEAVVSGKYEICGMQDKLAEKLESEGAVKIVHRSAYYPSSGIVASNSVSAEVINKVKQAMLDFEPEGKHRQNLYHWELTEMPRGFTHSKETDYEELRIWLEKLGLI